jgi:hypothetical protein
MIMSLPHAVSTGALATALYWAFEYSRRVNRLFETSKPVLAQFSENATYLWGEYELGPLKKILDLAKVIGPVQTLYALAHNEGCDRCRTWKGGERRHRRATCRNRLAPVSGSSGKHRFTDDPEVVRTILRGHRN